MPNNYTEFSQCIYNLTGREVAWLDSLDDMQLGALGRMLGLDKSGIGGRCSSLLPRGTG